MLLYSTLLSGALLPILSAVILFDMIIHAHAAFSFTVKYNECRADLQPNFIPGPPATRFSATVTPISRKKTLHGTRMAAIPGDKDGKIELILPEQTVIIVFCR